ncbi:uncharacterized protein PAE49_021092 [Odontesthes bonariensis]|uniref:uncharacterized protein LOC142369489 n=1 Tax=Odontesthes bonariensis TaxID=219752 RepID=UPI003F5879DB
MFYWTSCSRGGSEQLDGLGDMSKTDILRGIITEKLSTAAREILAVVERTVADYEEEASGFRRQIERQSRQMELLQPQVKLLRGGVEDPGGPSATWCQEEDFGEEKKKPGELKDPDPRTAARKRPGRPRKGGPRTHLVLRVRFLQDSQTEVLSNAVFQKSPVQDLRCPGGLREPDFLQLLRSTFPQLAAGEPFDLFTTDKSRRLQPLKVTPLTPEEVYSTIRSYGNSALYVRLKAGDDPQSSSADLRPPQNQNQDGVGSSSAPADWTEAMTRSSPPSDLSDRSSWDPAELGDGTALFSPAGSCQTSPQSAAGEEKMEEEEEEEVPQTDADPEVLKRDGSRFRTSPVKRAAGGPRAEANLNTEGGQDGGEAESQDGGEALDGDADWTPDPEPGTAKREGKPEADSGVKRPKRRKKACKVCGVWYRNPGSLIRHAWGHVGEPGGLCGVCGERFESEDEVKGHLTDRHKAHSCSHCGKSFVSVSSLRRHAALHAGSSRFRCSVCSRAFASAAGLRAHGWVHVQDRPHRCHVCPKAFGLKAQLTAHRAAHASRDEYRCKVCGKAVTNRRSLAFHQLTHSDERRHGCGVCGKSFKLSKTLKSHEKTHTVRERPYLCHVCCKTFVCNATLTAHVKTHSGERPFVCGVCAKAFRGKGELKNHTRVHTGEAPYGCSECGRFFKLRSTLSSHVRSHLGIKRFVCQVCGKACARPEHLTVHMRTHNGERPYKCSMCDKAFTQSHCLKTHLRSHQADGGSALEASTS